MLEMIWNHLWQSTLFAGAVATLALAFRNNRAHVRYWLWLAASVKFLIPFGALLWIGSQIELVPIERSGQEIIGVLDNAAEPFTQPPVRVGLRGRPVPSPPPTIAERSFTILWPAGAVAVVLIWTVRWRRVATSVRAATEITDSPLLHALRRLEGDASRIRLVKSSQAIEPGVFGIVSPVLMWPDGITERLSPAQIDAILAHEVAHVRRRDNLAAMIHMAVEALFWFHPLVWWIGARLVDERERACDEDVVGRGTEPDVYAESILKTCQFYVESRLRLASARQAPLVCVAGVTGSDLKRRVEHIMKHDRHTALTALKRVVLYAAMVAAIAIPVGVGIVTSPRLAAQIVGPGTDSPTFEVASIKPAADGGGRIGMGGSPGRVNMTGVNIRRLITQAYDIHDSQIIGGPDWLGAQAYDINATLAGTPSPDERRMMMKTLLRDRFTLTFHTEKRDLPIYALIVQRSDARLGPGLKRIPDDECPPPGSRRGAAAGGPPPPPASPFDPNAVAACGSLIFGPGRLLAHGVTIDMLARTLGTLPAITSFNRPVTNLTKLEGFYDFDFRFTPEFGRGGPPPPGSPAAAPNAVQPGDEPALFTALQEQLGLKLNPQRATLDVLVIDSIERPTEN
jgi:bla regulator protein blaR1